VLDAHAEVAGEREVLLDVELGVDDPEQYKGDPIPGGPTDPNAPELPGERRKREKMERQQRDG